MVDTHMNMASGVSEYRPKVLATLFY
jgi:hypothetical protein